MTSKTRKGLLIVMSAPAGTGKTTLADMVCKASPHVARSVSFTTRPPREGEIPGEDYHFISRAEFAAKLKRGDFLEHATVFGNEYGTDLLEIEKRKKEGKHTLLVIDTQGALQIQGTVPAVFIFIEPPSIRELEVRLRKRKTETEEALQKRLAWAQEELKVKHKYDYIVVNDDIEVAFEVLKSIIIAEEHRTHTLRETELCKKGH